MPAATVPIVVLVALFVTLIPTTIGALLSAIGIAGMDRLVRFNVLAMSGRAVEAAGDVDTLLLDKTGTITLGNRQAAEFLPVARRHRAGARRRRTARLARRRDAGGPLDRRAGQGEVRHPRPRHAPSLTRRFVPFTAQTRMSGVDIDGASVRKGAVDAVLAYVGAVARSAGHGARSPAATSVARSRPSPTTIAKAGGTPLAVAATAGCSASST